MGMDVLIGGLEEKRARTLEAEVRRTVSELQATDIVTIAVLPSDAENRWDVGVRRSDGWSLVRFDAADEDLSAQVAQNLRTSIGITR